MNDELSRDNLMQVFVEQAGFTEYTLHPLVVDASSRRYIRIITKDISHVIMDLPPERGALDSYITISNFLTIQGYSSPKIIKEDLENGFLLLEDLGDDIFNSLLSKFQDSSLEKEMYDEAVNILVNWCVDSSMQSTSSKINLPTYANRDLLRGIKIFTEWCLPEIFPQDHQTKALELLDIWERILLAAPLVDSHFVHRDYHAGNLIWLKSREGSARVGILDFQDAAWGDPIYDLVSLLQDARHDIPLGLVESILKRYIDATGQPLSLVQERYAILGAQRSIHIIGIFHRLNQRDNKGEYLRFLPRVWDHLQNDLMHPALKELKEWVDASISGKKPYTTS